jgi:hypothetical protein
MGSFGQGAGERRGVFFYEKKHQKTFAHGCIAGGFAFNDTPDAHCQGFLALVFKKERPAFLPPRRRAARPARSKKVASWLGTAG